MRFGHRKLGALLASSSLAALLVGTGAPAAFAQCAISPGTNQPSVSNSAAINCINIDGITVTGDVTNTGTGTLTRDRRRPAEPDRHHHQQRFGRRRRHQCRSHHCHLR